MKRMHFVHALQARGAAAVVISVDCVLRRSERPNDVVEMTPYLCSVRLAVHNDLSILCVCHLRASF